MPGWSDHETLIRFTAFGGVFLVMAGLETAFPRKQRVKPRLSRWMTNFGMVLIANLVIRFAIPVATIAFAVSMQDQGIGLFNWTDFPAWLEILLAMILLDVAIWAQHLAMHFVPVLWAIHRVHHADEDLDASSGIRFHPAEQILSLGFKLAVIALLGADPLAVFLFELILNASAMFNHASIRLPEQADRILRIGIVTPDFHRVHHSIHETETNSNFGFCLSVWDRLFRTYTPQPREGHEAMRLGLDTRPSGDTANLWWGLILPLRKDK